MFASPSRPHEPALPRVGDRMGGKYELESVLGEGGAGVVFAARHLQLGDRVAIKVLRPDIARDPIAAKRLVVEARATLAIRSPHVVRVLDVDVSGGGLPYLVMELLDGVDLRMLRQSEGMLPIDDVVRYVLEACSALAEAHACGIVHRDLKPANLFLTRTADGTPIVKVLDFGISKGAAFGLDESLTATTAILGSPAFMSPEQVRDAKNVDARTDIWALGVILYSLLANAEPFEGSTFSSLCAAIVADQPLPLRSRRAEVPERLEAAVMRCLDKDASRRFSSVTDLANELRACRLPLASRGRLLHVALGVLILAFGVWLVARTRGSPIAVEVHTPAHASAAPSALPPVVSALAAPAVSSAAPITPASSKPVKPKLAAVGKSAPSSEPPAPEASIDPLAHAY